MIGQVQRPILEILDYSYKSLSGVAIEALVQEIIDSRNPAIYGLVLRGNAQGFDDKGNKAIAFLLEQSHTLRFLDLSYNNLTSQQLGIIALGLKKNTHLEILNLGHNRLGGWTDTFTDALKGNQVLQVLLLNDNEFNNNDLNDLYNFLAKNTALVELNLTSNKFNFYFYLLQPDANKNLERFILNLQSDANKNLQRLILDWHLLKATERQDIKTLLACNARLSYNWGGGCTVHGI